MRTRFAVAFGDQTLDDGGEARVESVSRAFNSPFWPFVLISTSIGQEGLDFHLWCHAVVHWNLPSNPVDLEQREGRVHRYKGHAVRRNIATTFGPKLLADAMSGGVDFWSRLFAMAVAKTPEADGEMVPYWVFHQGPARIERHVPVVPFSREAAALPRLRKALAAYRLAFGPAPSGGVGRVSRSRPLGWGSVAACVAASHRLVAAVARALCLVLPHLPHQ